MKEIIKLSLQKELKRETEEIKKELERHPELAQMEVSEEKDAEFFERACALEAELKEERLNEETSEASISSTSNPTVFGASAHGSRVEPVVVYRRRRKKRTMLVALVAVLVLVMGLSMTSVGSKSYLKVLLERFAGEDENPMKILNVEDMDTMNSDDGKEATAYREIGEKLGIYAVEIKERPEDMVLVRTQMEAVLGQADLFYQYGDEIIRYTIYLNDEDSSWGELEEDKKIKEYDLTVNDVIITIKEYEVRNDDSYRRIAEFTYRGVHYRLKGIIEKEDFELILKNLHFF